MQGVSYSVETKDTQTELTEQEYKLFLCIKTGFSTQTHLIAGLFFSFFKRVFHTHNGNYTHMTSALTFIHYPETVSHIGIFS